MRAVQITCDACGKDITSTEEKPRFRLLLLAERLPHTSNIISGILVRPPIDNDRYFCGLDCLRNWIATEI